MGISASPGEKESPRSTIGESRDGEKILSCPNDRAVASLFAAIYLQITRRPAAIPGARLLRAHAGETYITAAYLHTAFVNINSVLSLLFP